MPKENILKQKSFDFAVRIVNLYKFLKKEYNEFVLSQQVVASGTSIGALIREAEHAESKRDFLHKLNIGLKLYATEFINKKMYDSLNTDCEELLKMLIASVKTTKSGVRAK
jgi:four helix bundle protein